MKYIHGMDNDLALMRNTLDLLDAHDLDACIARLSPDFRMHLAGLDEPLLGPEVWRGNTEYLLSAFADLRVRIDDAFTGDGRVVMLTTLSGTHTGEFLGVEATGRTTRWSSYEIYRVADGLIAEEWICSDLYSLTQRLTG